MIYDLPLTCIHVSPRTLRKLDPNRVAQHCAAFEAGDPVMPIDVRRTGDGYTIAGNGRHRYAGALAAGVDTIACRIR